MSDREWYEGLTVSELEGKHVHAVYDYGTVVDGELCRNGRVRLDHRDEDGAPVFVIDDGRVVNTFAHILSVSLVWDERDWEQIRTVDISKADAVVVNGLLYPVKGLVNHYWFDAESPEHPDGVSIPKTYVSCALRRRGKLPTEPGYYRDDFGIVFELTSGSPAEWWMLPIESKDSTIRPELVATHLPLTPVHFVDGRTE